MSYQAQAKWYVYELIDPRNMKPFYVGKGTGERVREHEKEALKGVCSKKCEQIRDIEYSGFSILRRKIASFWCEQSAYELEAELIRGGIDLTNIAVPLPPKPKGQPDYIEIIQQYSGQFAWWLKYLYPKLKAGKKAVFTYNDAATPKLFKVFGETFANKMAKQAMCGAMKQPNGKERLAKIFEPYGIELTYGG